MTSQSRTVATAFAVVLLSVSFSAVAGKPAVPAECAALPTHAQLRDALVAARKADNGGFNLDMWGSVVSRSGTVCAVAFTGKSFGDQWPGSRAISAQKAYTANAFSLSGLALATANLYSAVQPGGSLFGLQESNPVNPAVAMQGPFSAWGQPNDPLVGQRMGGINVFGGGLALYDGQGTLLGAVGVSGDSSCADHAIAWRTRNHLKLDHVPGGVGPGGVDQIAYEGDWKQPHCVQADKEVAVVKSLPPTRSKAASR